MKKTDFIRFFLSGNLVAFRGYDLKARWYRLTPKRLDAIGRLTRSWNKTQIQQVVTLRKPD